jgi:multiple sugar transport system permease protein
MGALIQMRSPEMYTLRLVLRNPHTPVETKWGAMMAGSVSATLSLFVPSSRRLNSGLTFGTLT